MVTSPVLGDEMPGNGHHGDGETQGSKDAKEPDDPEKPEAGGELSLRWQSNAKGGEIITGNGPLHRRHSITQATTLWIIMVISYHNAKGIFTVATSVANMVYAGDWLLEEGFVDEPVEDPTETMLTGQQTSDIAKPAAADPVETRGEAM